MAVWTIAAQEGTGGARVACELAAAAGVPLLDREKLAQFAHELDATFPVDDDLERRLCGRFNTLALNTAISVGSTEAFSELQLRKTLPGLGRAVLTKAACSPCVIYAPGAFAALSEHPSALHVHLCAPLEWRVAAYQREQLVDRRHAEKALKHDDQRTHAWVRSLYHVDIDEARHFSLVLDASRLSCERLVETLLVAGGIQAGVVAA